MSAPFARRRRRVTAVANREVDHQIRSVAWKISSVRRGSSYADWGWGNGLRRRPRARLRMRVTAYYGYVRRVSISRKLLLKLLLMLLR